VKYLCSEVPGWKIAYLLSDSLLFTQNVFTAVGDCPSSNGCAQALNLTSNTNQMSNSKEGTLGRLLYETFRLEDTMDLKARLKQHKVLDIPRSREDILLRLVQLTEAQMGGKQTQTETKATDRDRDRDRDRDGDNHMRSIEGKYGCARAVFYCYFRLSISIKIPNFLACSSSDLLHSLMCRDRQRGQPFSLDR
jgi:hypothetical protein